jgi:glycine betaine/proline transport system permease protein
VCEAVILGTGLWNDTMQTLTMTLVATLLVILIAMVFGVWMGRNRGIDTVVRPFLDALQTIPPFVYLVPALALFGPTRFTAIMAAVAYGVPIATKLIADGIRGVAPTSVEAARASGTTAWQMITKVQLPMARAALVLAGNQGLLYVLAMVVIGGLVGGGALGYLVVAGFSQAQLFGKGLAAGIAITALGVMLDRIAQHAAARYGRV